MDKSKKEILEQLSRLYILVAAIDNKFTEEEEIIIREKIGEWAPGLGQDELKKVMSSAASGFNSSDQGQIFNESSKTVNEYFDKNNKISVLQDLITIALSDGDFHDNERKIIYALAEDWGIDKDLDIGEYAKETAETVPGAMGNISVKAGNIFHDILSLLIYAGSESENGLNDPEWKIIYSGIANFNLVIEEKSFSLASYKPEEISQAADGVIERIWGSEDHPLNPAEGYMQSVKNIATYYKQGILDNNNVYAVIRLMLEVASADGLLTASQKNILEEIVNTFNEVSGVGEVNNLIKNQLKKQEKQENPESGSQKSKGGNIGMSFVVGKEPEITDQEEVIAEVYKEGGTCRARIRGTQRDITEVIDDPEKLIKAYKQSGLLRGKLKKDGGYNWRVMKKES